MCNSYVGTDPVFLARWTYVMFNFCAELLRLRWNMNWKEGQILSNVEWETNLKSTLTQEISWGFLNIVYMSPER